MRALALSGLLLGIGAAATVLLVWQQSEELARGLAELRHRVQVFQIRRPSSPPTATSTAVPGPALWLRWLALNELQLARQSLAGGQERSGLDRLASARRQLAQAGGSAQDQARIREIGAHLAATPVLVPERLEFGLEQLEAVWLRIAQAPASAATAETWWSLPTWMAFLGTDTQETAAPADRLGREDQILLERLRRWAWRGDPPRFRAALADLAQRLNPVFRDHPEGAPWLVWLEYLAEVPLRHDLGALEALIAQWSADWTRELCAVAATTAEPCPRVLAEEDPPAASR